MKVEPVDVVHLVLMFDKGGLEMVALNLSRRLRAAGRTAAVVALDGGGATFDLAVSEGIPCLAVGGRRLTSPGFHRRVRQALAAFRPRVLHTHHMSALLNSLPAGATLPGMRRVHTEHSCLYLSEHPRLRRPLRWASRVVDVFVPVAESMRGLYVNSIGIDSRKVRVIPNGIDTGRFRPATDGAERAALRAKLGLPAGILVGSAGRLTEVKNYPMLLEAVAEARAAIPDIGLVLLGDGEDREALGGLAARLGITERVTFAGWRHDTDDWLRALDLFTLSSHSEALPLALLEAMASGLPVVSTAVGDVTGILDRSGGGRHVPVGDGAGYRALIARSLGDLAWREAAGRAGRTFAVDHYSIEAMAAGYSAAYGFDHG